MNDLLASLGLQISILQDSYQLGYNVMRRDIQASKLIPALTPIKRSHARSLSLSSLFS
jgi:hypothetical protein